MTSLVESMSMPPGGDRWRTGPGGRKARPEGVAQQILDAAARLQIRRTEVAARVAGGDCPGAELLAVGDEINPFLWRDGATWKDVLAVHPGHTTESLRAGLPVNRAHVESSAGLRLGLRSGQG